MDALLPPLMVYAACGLVLSLTVHILSFFGIALGGTTLFFALHIGIFPLWIPVVFIGRKMAGDGMRRGDFWKAALSGCPLWMRYMTYGFFAYAVANFVLFMFYAPVGQKNGANVPATVVHGFSGHWMAFYSAGLAILTTAYRRGLSNLQRTCPFGHDVGWSDRFCPTCGASIPPASGAP
jgi:hypothetical protein